MISIIIPCYNEQEVIPMLYSSLTATAREWGLDYEIILVDDGSRDATPRMLQQIHDQDPRWKIIRHSRNFGQQAALSSGLLHASGDCAVIMDADLQDPPKAVPQFLSKWREGFEVVYGVRRRRKECFFKRLAYWAFYSLLVKTADISIPAHSGDFCLLDRKIINLLNAMPERNRFLRGLRAWTGFRQVGVEVERGPRASGKPKYSFAKLRQLAIDGIFSFSVLPIRLTTYFGMVVSLFAFLLGFYTLVWRLFSGTDLPGYATTVISVLFLGGVQLVSIGIIGEYIARIYDEVKMRPLSIIEYKIGFAETPQPYLPDLLKIRG